MDLNKVSAIHFVGIKGVAMTALAVLASEKGKKITGSDLAEEFPTDTTLKRYHITPQAGFSPGNLPEKLDLVIYTGAHQGVKNIEVGAAITRGIPVQPHGKALGFFMKGKKGITVTGSHGKTTTSAIIAHILTQIGQDPCFAIGCGEILSLKTSGHWGRGELFVAEGDEYVTDPQNDLTPRFMWQKPEIVIVTNIDFDHPDVYADLKAVKFAFIDFANSLPPSASMILNIDNEVTASIIPFVKRKIFTYGEAETVDFRLQYDGVVSGETKFRIINQGQIPVHFSLRVPGRHNAQNATAAIASLACLGFGMDTLVSPLASFNGTKRRFEFVVEKNGKLLYDDYAHHPTEISATLKAAKEWFPGKRLIVIFQPHTYSRTQALLVEFANCFADADLVILTEIYASAREMPISGVSGEILFAETKGKHSDVYFAPNMDNVLQYLQLSTRSNDLILTMGAGDIFTWLPRIVEML